MQASLRLNVKPILITSLTTSLAMLCLNIHDSPTVASFGNTVAIGVMIAMLLSLSVTPLLMIFTSNQRVSGQDVLHTCVKSLSRIITAKKSRLFNLTSLMVGSLLLIFAIAGVGKLSSEESITQTFDQAFEFRKANDYLNQHLTGLHQLSIRIQNDKGSIINPTDLHKVDQLTRWLTSQSEVAYVDSITNELHQVKHIISGEPISEPLPTEPAILSQYWLLYQLGSPSITHRLTKVSLDEKTLLVSFRLWETDTNTMIDLESRLRAQIEATFSDHSSIRLDISGIDLAFAHLVTHNIDTLVKGTLAALFLVACLIMISLKSFRLGLVAVLTNLVPIIIVFGSWGHMVGNLGLSAASVGAITLGLVVDDTVHLIYRYFSLRSTAVKSSHQPMKKLTSAQCLAHTIEQVGPALVITTLIFSLGFSCLIFSHYVPTQIFGGLSAAILLTALAVDLIFLPSFFMFCIRNTFTKNKKQTNVNNLRIECQKEKSTNHPRGKVETTSSPEKSLS